MTDEQQIHEIAKDICGCIEAQSYCPDCYNFDKCKIAEKLFQMNYRKQQEGEWIIPTNRICSIICSSCETVIDLDEGEDYLHWDYCPICGAKMKVGV